MLREFLIHEFEKRRLTKPNYSLRKFARDIGINPSVVSKILAGKRQIKVATAYRIVKRLEIHPRTRTMLLLSTLPESEKFLFGTDPFNGQVQPTSNDEPPEQQL